MSQMLPADSVKAMGPDDVTKSAIRTVIWKYIEENDLADFPRPVTRRIPNVKGASTAAELIPQMPEFKKAQVVKVNQDKPQEQARFLTIDAGKTLLVPTPRLRNGLFNRINPPSDATKDILRICSTSQGVREYSSTLPLDEKVKIDLVITGSVAVSKKGVRIGKGEGFADLDWAMMAAVGAVSPDTVVITTVSECQIVDIPDQLMSDHDLPVDYIVTPSEIIKCNRTQNKPAGIIWSKVEPSKLRRIPILRKIWVMEKEAGKDVTLKDGQEFDLEAAEKDDQEREQRRKERMEQEGEEEGGRRRFRRFRRRFGGRYGGSGRGRGQGRPQSRDRTESEGAEGTDGERQESGGGGEGSQDRKDHTRPRRYRRRPNPRRSKSPQGEGDGSGDARDREPREPRDRREPREPRDRREPREPRDRREPREPRDRREPREPRDRREPREPRDRERNEFDGEGNENRRPQRRRLRPRRGRQPSLFVGGLPRSLRVSTFKTEVRGRDVDPLRVIWHGVNGHAFLQFENADIMESALTALGDLNINGKKLRVEEAKGYRSQERTSQNDDSRRTGQNDDSRERNDDSRERVPLEANNVE